MAAPLHHSVVAVPLRGDGTLRGASAGARQAGRQRRGGDRKLAQSLITVRTERIAGSRAPSSASSEPKSAASLREETIIGLPQRARTPIGIATTMSTQRTPLPRNSATATPRGLDKANGAFPSTTAPHIRPRARSAAS